MKPVYINGVCAPCIHGDLCRGYLNKYRKIYSNRCPHGCEFYEPDNTNFVYPAYPYVPCERNWHHDNELPNNQHPKFPQKFIPATC